MKKMFTFMLVMGLLGGGSSINAQSNSDKALNYGATVSDMTRKITEISAQANIEHITSDTIIGKEVRNLQNIQIGSVSDFIINERGKIFGMVVSHGGVFGHGDKEIMLDFEILEARADNNDYVTRLTEKNVHNYPAFNRDDLTNSMYLASDLLGSNIVNQSMSTIGQLENLVVEDSDVTTLIINYFNGVVPKKALVNFDDVEIVRGDDDNDMYLKLLTDKSTRS